MSSITKFTANIKTDLMEQLKDLIKKDESVSTISFALNDAIEQYLKMKHKMEYKKLMGQAVNDKGFIERLKKVEENYNLKNDPEKEKW